MNDGSGEGRAQKINTKSEWDETQSRRLETSLLPLKFSLPHCDDSSFRHRPWYRNRSSAHGLVCSCPMHFVPSTGCAPAEGRLPHRSHVLQELDLSRCVRSTSTRFCIYASLPSAV